MSERGKAARIYSFVQRNFSSHLGAGEDGTEQYWDALAAMLYAELDAPRLAQHQNAAVWCLHCKGEALEGHACPCGGCAGGCTADHPWTPRSFAKREARHPFKRAEGTDACFDCGLFESYWFHVKAERRNSACEMHGMGLNCPACGPCPEPQ